MLGSRIDNNDLRVAWLLPDMGTGGISFQLILSEFTKAFPNTITFTGQWPGYVSGLDNKFIVEKLGAVRHIELLRAPSGYSIGFTFASPQIAQKLLLFKPHVVFANAFSLWTVLALALKAIGRWKVIITYEGGSPTYETKSPSIRLLTRRLIVKLADAFVVNSQSGKAYFTDVLNVPIERIFAKPFLVPSVKALLQGPETLKLESKSEAKRPVFLYVGQIIPRKGLNVLLEACALLKQQGYKHFTVWVVGDGEQKAELQSFANQAGLNDQIEWFGKVEYGCLGSFFQASDVFIFPTYEDIWGMVLVEAMAFGKPVLCSKAAGAVELVVHRENGLIFNPLQSSELAECMKQCICNPSSIPDMSKQIEYTMSFHSPEMAAESFREAIRYVINEIQY